MPKLIVPVAETLESITRPIVMEVMRKLSKRTGIPAETNILFLHTAIQSPQPSSTLDDQGARVKLPSSNKYTITVSETYPEDTSLSDVSFRPEQIAFFIDNDLEVRLIPVYKTVEISMDIRFRTHDKNTAQLWYQDMKSRASRGKQDDLHEVSYHYPIPLACMMMLDKIYELRENNAGYGDTFGEWLKECFSEKMSVISNQAGNHPTFVIRENQQRVMGWYEFLHQPPENDRDSDTGTWATSFTYKFRFDRVEEVVIQHPYMIHNQIIPKKFRDDTLPYTLMNRLADPNLTQKAFQQIINDSSFPSEWRGEVGLRIPYYDDWYPTYQHPDTQSLLRILLQIEEDPTHIVNLESLGNWEFKEEAIAYMKDTPMSMTQPGESVFNITLHRRNNLMDITKIVVNEDLDVLYISDDEVLEHREYYHLHVSLFTNLMALSESAKTRLGLYGAFTVELLTAMYPGLAARGLLPTLNADGTISLYDLLKAFSFISELHGNTLQDAVFRWRLVGTFFVESHRR